MNISDKVRQALWDCYDAGKDSGPDFDEDATKVLVSDTIAALRDELVRLVVGQQWREMGYLHVELRREGLLDEDGGTTLPLSIDDAPDFFEVHRPADDIVDEHLR